MVAICIVCFSGSKAYSQFYFGGGVGWSYSGDLTNFREVGPSGFLDVDLAGTDLKTDDSLVIGGKMGYFPEALSWMGVELNVYHRDPDVKRQDWTIGGTGAGNSQLFPGTGNFTTTMDIDATTVGILMLFKPPPKMVEEYLLGTFEPYVGIGVGLHIVSADIKVFNAGGTLVGSSDRTRFGDSILVSAGLNLKITDNIKIYGEYLYSNLNVDTNEDDDCFINCTPNTSFNIPDNTVMTGLVFSF
jgi:hypothetical protein